MKILVVNLGGIGDLLISAAALKAIKERFAGARLSVLGVKRAQQVAAFMPFVDRWYTPGDLLRLRREQYDLAVNMRTLVSGPSALKMRLLFSLVGAAVWAGRNTSGRGNFFSIAIPEEDIGSKHEQTYDIELAQALGAHVADTRFTLEVPLDARSQVDARLLQSTIPADSLLVGMHPGGKPSHRWPLERFIELARRIDERLPQAVFVLTGEAAESRLCAAILEAVNAPCVNLAGELTLVQTAALLARVAVLITNDTGIMQMAAFENVAQVALFGPGYLERYDPRYFSSQARVLQGSAECAPCTRNRCADLRCLKQISVDAVEAEVLKVLQR